MSGHGEHYRKSTGQHDSRAVTGGTQLQRYYSSSSLSQTSIHRGQHRTPWIPQHSPTTSQAPHEVAECEFPRAMPKQSSPAEKRPKIQSFPEQAKQGMCLCEFSSSQIIKGNIIRPLGPKEKRANDRGQLPRGSFPDKDKCVSMHRRGSNGHR